MKKSQMLAAVLSFIIVGLGQVYCAIGIEESSKQIIKGVIFFAIGFILSLIFLPLSIVWWIINIVDAYQTAKLISEDKYVWSFVNLKSH